MLMYSLLLNNNEYTKNFTQNHKKAREVVYEELLI